MLIVINYWYFVTQMETHGKKKRFWNDLSVYNFSGERDPEKRVRFDESVVKSEDGKNWRQRERERERELFPII